MYHGGQIYLEKCSAFEAIGKTSVIRCSNYKKVNSHKYIFISFLSLFPSYNLKGPRILYQLTKSVIPISCVCRFLAYICLTIPRQPHMTIYYHRSLYQSLLYLPVNLMCSAYHHSSRTIPVGTTKMCLKVQKLS